MRPRRPWPTPWPPTTARRSSAPSWARSTPARWIPSASWPTSPHAAGALAARRRRVRAVGAAPPTARHHLAAGRRARRLVGHRRAQVAQRPLRLRPRLLRPPGGPPPRPRRARRLPGARPPGSATPSTGRPSSPAAPGASPSTRRCAGSAGPASAELVDRCCDLAQRFAVGLEAMDAEVLNDVVLNQVLVSFGSDERDASGHRAPAGRR